MDGGNLPVGVLTGDTALILAGGEGTRLLNAAAPEVRSKPKLLVEICPKDGTPVPMLDYVVSGLAASGINGIAVVTAPSEQFGDAIERHIASSADQRLRPSIIRETERRGTGMAACRALRCVYSNTAFVLPGDILFPFHCLPEALLAHEESGYPVTWTVTTHQDEAAQNFGRIACNVISHRVTQSFEGSSAGNFAKFRDHEIACTSAGVIIFSREQSIELFSEYLADRPSDHSFDLYREFLPWIIARETPVGYYDVHDPVYDLGSPERLYRFGRQIKKSPRRTAQTDKPNGVEG